MPRISSSAQLVLALVVLGACGQEPGGRASAGVTAGGKGDDLEGSSSSSGDSGGDALPESDHHGEIEQCEAVAEHVRAHVNLARVDAVVDLERNRNDCLVRADDAAIDLVDARLTAAADPYVGQAVRMLKTHRDDAISLCNALVEADPAASSDALAGVATACISGVELQLARVLDAYVDFGVAPFSIPAARDSYPDCYAELDAELADAPGLDPDAEEAAAQQQLAACIVAVHDTLLPELAARVATSFPGRDAQDVEASMADAVLALHETRMTLCTIAVHAGPSAGTASAELDIAECMVDVAIQAGEAIGWVAPELLADDGELGTSDDGGSSDDGGGSSSDAGAEG